MANEKNLKPFKKGETGNPNGRPANPPELRELQKMTKGEFEVLMHKLVNCKPEDLGQFKGTVLEMALASTIQKAIKEGDSHRIEFFLQRLFGKVKEEVSSEITAVFRFEDYTSKK